MKEVSKERTGWRDERISRLHREWGYDCPAVDIDFLLIEYDEGIPVALVEYKHEEAQPVDRDHPSYRAMLHLTSAADIPLFVVRYSDDLSQWAVTPIGYIARLLIHQKTTMTQAQFIDFLYELRGRSV